MSEKAYEISNEQIIRACHRWISDLGKSWMEGGRTAMFWRASLATGIPANRLKTIYYNMGASVSAPEYLTIAINWRKIQQDRELAELRDRSNKNRERLDDIAIMEAGCVAETFPLLPGLG